MTPADYALIADLFAQASTLAPEQREAFLRNQPETSADAVLAIRRMLTHDAQFPNDASVDEFGIRESSMLLTPEAAAARAQAKTAGSLAAADGQPASSSFGRYELLQEIGRGGMGIVFRARQTRPDRIVAVKTIRVGRFASNADVQRFMNEAEAAAQLDHEGIVPVYDVGCEQGSHFFSMQFVEGTNLAEVLKTRGMSRDELLTLFVKVCDAVAHCHRKGIVHRDLKPSNILIDRRSQPRITDFGLARHLEKVSTLTATGDIMGTPGYMPPEQAFGESTRVGPTADVYSLGAILYHILTGRPPILAQDVNLAGAIQLVRDHDVLSPKVLVRSVPRDLDIICAKCLEKEPLDRYLDAGELVADIRRFLDNEPIHARGLRWHKRVTRWARQQPGLAATWATVFLFYAWHLVHFYVLPTPDVTWFFHFATTATAATWAVAAWVFQRLLVRYGGKSRILFSWATLDVLLLTLFLATPGVDGARSHLVYLYFPIVANATLRFRTQLVVYVAVLVVAAYLLHSVHNNLSPDLPNVSLAEAVTFVLSVLTLGIVQYFALRRSRVALETLARRDPLDGAS